MCEQEGEEEWTEREGEEEIDVVCLFLSVASAALVDPAAAGQPRGNLGCCCFDYIKIDSSPQTPHQLCVPCGFPRTLVPTYFGL